MSFAFTKKLTGDIRQLFEKAKASALHAGGTISGDECSGNFSGKTPLGQVVGTYTVTDGVLSVVISKKPPFVPESIVRDVLNGYFS